MALFLFIASILIFIPTALTVIMVMFTAFKGEGEVDLRKVFGLYIVASITGAYVLTFLITGGRML